MYEGAILILSVNESSKIFVYNSLSDSNKILGIKIYILYAGSTLFLAACGVNFSNSVFFHSQGTGCSIRIEKHDLGLNFDSNKRNIKHSLKENMKSFVCISIKSVPTFLFKKIICVGSFTSMKSAPMLLLN